MHQDVEVCVVPGLPIGGKVVVNLCLAFLMSVVIVFLVG